MRISKHCKMALGTLTLALIVGMPPWSARAETGTFPPQGWRGKHVRVVARPTRATARFTSPDVPYRGLTVNRAPSRDSEDDILDDGATRYNDIASFNPAPAITSGTQLPYGLDGIGGFGRDLGFAEEQDSSVYQRRR